MPTSQKVQIDTFDFGASLTLPTLGALATGTTIANGTAATCDEQTADSGVYIADFVGADASALIPAGTYRLRTAVNGLPLKRFVTFAGVDGEVVYARSEEAAALNTATQMQIDDMENDVHDLSIAVSLISGTQLPAIQTDVNAANNYLSTISSRIGAFAGAGVNTILGFFKAIMSKTASTPSDVGGTFDPATNSTEAIRDRGDAAWTTGSGGVSGGGSPVFTAVVVARIATGAAAGWPEDLTIGDAYLSENAGAQPLFIKDVSDNILSGLGTKLFSDADFVATLRLAPLTDGTRTLDSPPTTIEVKSTDAIGILYNDDTAGAEYFELQIPRDKTLLGVTKTKYSCQFIMNWGDSNEFERTVNLGEIKFLRKNAPAT